MRDDSGAATAIWFNQGFLARTLQKGQTLQLRATVRAGRGLELTVREHEVLAEAGEGLHTSGVVAVYDASRTLSTRVIRELVEQHLPRTDAIADPLPVGVRVARRLPLRRDAIASLHAPQAPEDTRIASDRLAYEELLLLQVALAERRAGAPAAEALGRPGELLERYHASLPFTLTLGPEAQRARHRPRPRARRPPDAPPAARRRRLGQDGGRRARDAARGRARRPGRAARADRGARPAARRDGAHARRAARHRGGGRHRRPAGGGAAGAAAAHRLRRRRARRRHARAAREERRVRASAA